ncbi:uncharacterized protein LOC117172114 [Belonocnema kinseyi]|uniref:uncharacterized protein LOC117172114 n=1 Tax=Belonocnema kinseyi TaxID=2817044 RepID=UPI00143DBBCD|nr:uncharacterized protein LOC117172114 [Belonocnema kinseyi]
MKFIFASLFLISVVLIQLSVSKRICGPWDESKLQLLPGMKPFQRDCVLPGEANTPEKPESLEKSGKACKSTQTRQPKQDKKAEHKYSKIHYDIYEHDDAVRGF